MLKPSQKFLKELPANQNRPMALLVGNLFISVLSSLFQKESETAGKKRSFNIFFSYKSVKEIVCTLALSNCLWDLLVQSDVGWCNDGALGRERCDIIVLEGQPCSLPNIGTGQRDVFVFGMKECMHENTVHHVAKKFF